MRIDAISIFPQFFDVLDISLHWVAVRAMVLRKETNRVMDELWAVGARGILVTDIHACRL